MVEQPHTADLEAFQPPAVSDPRAAAFSAYWRQAHEAATVSAVLMGMLRDQMAGGVDDIAAVYKTFEALEVTCGDLGRAVKGFDAVLNTKGIA